MFRHIKPFIKENSKKLVVSVILLIIIDVIALITPWILGVIIDELSAMTLKSDSLTLYIGILLGIELLLLILRFVMRVSINKAAYQIEYKIRGHYFRHLLNLDSEFYSEQKTGDLMARATNDITSIRMIFVEGIVMSVDSVLIIFMILLITTSSISLELTLVSIVNLPIMAIFIILGGSLFGKRYKKLNETFGKVSEKAREFFSGIKLLKAFNKEDKIGDVFATESVKLYKDSIKTARTVVILNPFIRVIAYTSTIIAVFYGGTMVLDSKISIGMFVSFMAYLQKLTWPFMAIGFLMAILQMGFASITRLNQIFDRVSEIDDSMADTSITEIDGSIRVENLSFAYPSTSVPSLKHISFEIQAGQTLGVIGMTGSGKSTLANLLVRRYDAIEDSIFIGDVPIKHIPLNTLLDNVGYAFQESVIFSDTVKNNISIKDPDINMETLVHYSEIASIHKDILDMEEGYDSILGEKGVNLSGGQKQRLSLARALVHRPKIVILDDALSAVDNKIQSEIVEELKKELDDKTTVIISHRISTIKHADKIIVLDDGFKVQEGTHDFLVEVEGLYRELYKKQMSDNVDLEEAE